MSEDIWTPGVVDTVKGFDAATCPDPVPPGYEWCMIYAGGSSASDPNGWPDDALARVAHLPRLVVWVPTPGIDNPRTAARQFLAWLHRRGVPTDPKGKRTLLMVDEETGRLPNPTWTNAFCGRLALAGYDNLPYGSLSTIFGEPARSGYVVANPTGQPHMYPHAQVAGTQYAFDVGVPGGVVDETLLRRDLLGQLWQPGA